MARGTRATETLVTNGNIVQDFGVLVKGGVEESDRSLLASLNTLVDNTVHKTGHKRSGLRGTTRGTSLAADDDSSVQAVSGNIRVATTCPVVDTASGGDGVVGGGVGWVSGIVLRQVAILIVNIRYMGETMARFMGLT